MKKRLFLGMGSILIMILMPYMNVTFSSNDTGMLIFIVSLLILNPIWAIVTGLVAGQQIRLCWYFPFLMDLFFIIGYMKIFRRDYNSYLFYIGLYTAIALLTMGITVAVKKFRIKKEKKNR